MASPFPGMDPFIEGCGLWEGFHNRLIHKIDETLANILPKGYTIDTAVRSYVVLVGKDEKKESLAKPDLGISEAPPRRNPRRKPGGAALVEPPGDTKSVLIQAFIAERFEETFVEIHAEEEERVLVTCIEVLSPSNKRPNTEGWSEYQRKRQALLPGQANLVEIDLLLGGQKMPMREEWPISPYRLLVSRQGSNARCRVWPVSFERRLPPIPIPLRDPDPELTLDLQPLIDAIYSFGRYEERLDYSWSLKPALSTAEASYVREILRNRTGRPQRKGRSSS